MIFNLNSQKSTSTHVHTIQQVYFQSQKKKLFMVKHWKSEPFMSSHVMHVTFLSTVKCIIVQAEFHFCHEQQIINMTF